MTIHAPRTSSPSLLAVSRGIAGAREEIVAKWAKWIAGRATGGRGVDDAAMQRMLALVADLLVEMAGPLHREVEETWFATTELYGTFAALRGLTAAEVVEELHRLRELVVLELADFFVALPARQQLPTFFRFNKVLDSAVTNAVVGYTDHLVKEMFGTNGVPVPTADSLEKAVAALESLESELRHLAGRSPR